MDLQFCVNGVCTNGRTEDESGYISSYDVYIFRTDGYQVYQGETMNLGKIAFCVVGVACIIVFAIACCTREGRIEKILKSLEKKKLDKKLDEIIELEKIKKRG